MNVQKNLGLPSPREQVLELVKDVVDLHPSVSRFTSKVAKRRTSSTTSALSFIQTQRCEDGARKIRSYSSRHSPKRPRACKCVASDTRDIYLYIGRFRWVYCQLETLHHCLPPSVRRILGGLPETLDETYERVLREIHETNQEHSLRLLQCLAVAIRPLRAEELAEILAIDFDAVRQNGIPKLNADWRWEDQREAILSTCSSLVAVVDEDGSEVVQFSHFSVKEFLTLERLARSNGDISRYHIVLEPAHSVLVQACLGVLLRLNNRVDDTNAQDTPLVEYAARYWVDHARFENVSSRIRDAMEYFFDADKPH
jgi:hypothetical protein